MPSYRMTVRSLEAPFETRTVYMTVKHKRGKYTPHQGAQEIARLAYHALRNATRQARK